jgi:hypothetical protein
MRIVNIRTESADARTRAVGTVTWEDCGRPSRDVYFETTEEFGGHLSVDTDSFLAAATMAAFAYGEKRLSVEGEICPVLSDGLVTAMTLVSHWYRLSRKPVVLQGKTRSTGGPRPSEKRAAVFLSGDIESLATLRANRLNYQPRHPATVRDGFVVYGLDDQPPALEPRLASLSALARATDLTLIPISTNLRSLDSSCEAWSDLSGAAGFSSIAHAFKPRIGRAHIAATADIPNLSPHVSHPLLDPNYSSADVAIRHDGVALSWLAKTRLVAEWDVALATLRVCHRSEDVAPGYLNCGACEPCLRALLALLALGALERAITFPPIDLSEELVMTTVELHGRNAHVYRELVAPLQEIGRHDLARSIQHKLDRYLAARWRRSLASLERHYLDGRLRRIRRLWHRDRGAGPGLHSHNGRRDRW